MIVRRAAALLALLLALALIAPAAAGAAGEEEPGRRRDHLVGSAGRRGKGPQRRQGAEREHPNLAPSPTYKNEHWEVGWFEDDHEYALVMVDPKTGEVTESWTGYQVAWEMARGYSGEFAHSLNSPFIWLPLCPSSSSASPTGDDGDTANLDLLVLLGFGVSHFFFNQGNVGVSVPLAYPVLVYLLVRCLWIGFRGRGTGLRPVWPTMWLLIAALFLMGFRVGLNMADAGAINVGYAASPAPTGSSTANSSTATGPRTSTPATPTGRSTTRPTCRSSWSGPTPPNGTTCPPPTAPRSPSTSSPSFC